MRCSLHPPQDVSGTLAFVPDSLSFPSGLAATAFKTVRVIAIKPGFQGIVPVRALGASTIDTLYNGKTNDTLKVYVEATRAPEVLVSTSTLETAEGTEVVYQVRHSLLMAVTCPRWPLRTTFETHCTHSATHSAGPHRRKE